MASVQQEPCLKATDHEAQADSPEAAFFQGLAVLIVPPLDPANLGLETEVKEGGEEGQRGRKRVSRLNKVTHLLLLSTLSYL